MVSLFRHAYNSIFRPEDTQMVVTSSSLISDPNSLEQDYRSSRLLYDNRSDETLKLMKNVIRKWDGYEQNGSTSRYNDPVDMHRYNDTEQEESTRDIEFIIRHVEQNNKFILKIIETLNKFNIGDDLKQLELLKDLQLRYNELLIKYNKMDLDYKNDREFAKKTFKDYELLVRDHQRLKLEFEDYVPKKAVSEFQTKVRELERENSALSKEINAEKSKSSTTVSDLELENKRLRLKLDREREQVDTLQRQLKEARNQLKLNKINADKDSPKNSFTYEAPSILKSSTSSSSASAVPHSYDKQKEVESPLKTKLVRSSRLSASNYNSNYIMKNPPKTDDDTIARFKKQYEDLRVRTRVPLPS